MNIHPALWGRLIIGGFIALLAMQLVPYGHNHVNPPITSEPAWDSADTRALARGCTSFLRLSFVCLQSICSCFFDTDTSRA